MARRSEHSQDEIREMALMAAEALIESGGLAGISARKVAAEIGYTAGTLYMVFDSFDDLLLQMNGRTLERLHDQLDQSAQSCRTPHSCLRALAHAYVEYALAHPRGWGAIFEHRLPPGRRQPAWYKARIERIFDLVEQYIRKFDGSGRQAAAAARVLWSGVHGICVLHLSGKLPLESAAQLRSLIDNMIDNYLAGWIARGSR